MAANEIHLDDVGVEFRITLTDNGVVVDISSATILFIFKKPSGTLVNETGSLYTDGTDGIAKYVSESGLLDEVGSWKYQIKVTIGSSVFYSDLGCFEVYGNLS